MASLELVMMDDRMGLMVVWGMGIEESTGFGVCLNNV